MTGSLATSAIITRGLHGGPATLGLITTRFSIYVSTAPEPVARNSGGGPYPRPAHNVIPNISNFYQPIEQPLMVPKSREFELFRPKNVEVVIKIDIAGFKKESIFGVRPRNRNIIIRAFYLLNVTTEKFSAIATNVRVAARKFKVFATNVVRRKNK